MLSQKQNISENILKGIYENLPVSISRINKDGWLLEVKGNICDKNANHENIEFNYFNYYPYLRPYLEEILIKRTGVYSYETQIPSQDGSVRYFNNSAFPVENEEGDVELIIVSLDITKDTLAKESLNKKNKELKAIFDAVPDIYLRINDKGIILDYKSGPISNYNIPPELQLGKPIYQFIEKKITKILNKAIERVRKKNKLFSFVYSEPSGINKKYFEARFFPLYENEIIVIVRDITKRKIVEEKIKEKDKLLLETQKIAKIFSFIWDLKTNIVTWTDEFYRLIQKKPWEFENTPEEFLNYVHPQDKQSLILEIESTIKNKSNLYVEYRFITPDKKVIYLSTEAKLKINKKGNPIKMIGFTQDITDRKLNELELITRKMELENVLENIESIISQKTAEVILAKENAEKANQAKTLFLANISHELKTPIHAIMSFAELGMEKIDKLDKEKIKDYFSKIYQSGERLYTLMNNLLDLSKLEIGNETYKFENEDILKLTNNIVQELEGLLKKKNLTIQLQKNTDCTIVCMDTSKIMQVIRNLLSNAIKFSQENSLIKIEITSGNYFFPGRDKKEEAIIWKIIDSGEGILEEEKEIIFEKFEKGKKYKSGNTGTGLGLAISKEIIQGHRGIIFAKNHSVLGAEFTFVIPKTQNI